MCDNVSLSGRYLSLNYYLQVLRKFEFITTYEAGLGQIQKYGSVKLVNVIQPSPSLIFLKILSSSTAQLLRYSFNIEEIQVINFISCKYQVVFEIFIEENES